jgi:hypothetical protein
MATSSAPEQPSTATEQSTRGSAETSWLLPVPEVDEEAQFSLAALMLSTTAVAIALGIVRIFGWMASVPLFIASLVLTTWLYPKLRPNQVAHQIMLFDVVWGIVMPIVCLALDPLVFRESAGALPRLDGIGLNDAVVTDLGFFAYPILGCQMLFLIVWLVAKPKMQPIRTVFHGWLLMGSIMALMIGMMLFPVAFFGTLLFGLGLAGFTPLFTAYAYARRAKQAAGCNPRNYFTSAAMTVAVVAMFLPAVAGAIVLGLMRGWDRLTN